MGDLNTADVRAKEHPSSENAPSGGARGCTIPDTVFVVNREGRIVDVVVAHEPFGTPDTLRGRLVTELQSVFPANQVVAATSETLGSGVAQVLEYEVVREGRRYCFEGRSSLIHTHPAPDNLVVWVARDVSDQVEWRQALLDSEERLRGVLERSPLGMCFMDSGLRLGLVNPRLGALVGAAPTELVGQSLVDLAVAEDRRALQLLTAEVFSGQCGRAQIELRLVRRDGETTWAAVSVSLLDDHARGGPVALGVVEDISVRMEAELQIRDLTNELERRVEQRTSELARANEALEQAKNAAEAASQTKSAFLAKVSHEIRTPMNAILGHAQLLEQSAKLPRSLRDRVATILRSGEHLLAVINDVLDSSKLEAGRVTVHAVDFSPRELLEDLERMFGPRAELKHITLSVRVEDAVPARISADEGKLRQILVNLIGNAVKFTPSGWVNVQMRVDGTECGPTLVVEVADTGVGIPASESTLVFAPFEQTSAGRLTGGGTGLGLSISRQFAELMGGELTFESQWGAGTTFRLSLPLMSSNPNCTSLPSPQPRVLLISGPDSGLDIRVPLARAGFVVRQCPTMEDALPRAAGFRPIVALLDGSRPTANWSAHLQRLRHAIPQASIIALVTPGSLEELAAVAAAVSILAKTASSAEVVEAVRVAAYAHHSERSAADLAPIEVPEPMGERMASLPPHLVARMHEATTNGDVDQLMVLINGAARVDPQVAEHLRGLASDYEYDKLDALLRLGRTSLPVPEP